MLLDISFGMKKESELVIKAVESALKKGYRTTDIADASTLKNKILNTSAMGEIIVAELTNTSVVDTTALNTASFIASTSIS